MVRDEILRAFRDPGEVADAELLGLAEGSGEHESRWVGERAGLAGGALSIARRKPMQTQLLGYPEVETKQFAAISGHLQHPNDH